MFIKSTTALRAVDPSGSGRSARISGLRRHSPAEAELPPGVPEKAVIGRMFTSGAGAIKLFLRYECYGKLSWRTLTLASNILV